MRKDNYEKQWEEIADYRYSEQFQIYKFVCGDIKRKRQWKKIPVDKRFTRYKEWKCYVKSKFQTLSVDQLIEFNRFLNNKKRGGNTYLGILKTFFTPISVAMLSAILIPALMDYPVDNFKSFITDFDGMHWIEIMIRLGTFFILFFLMISFLTFAICIFVFQIYDFISDGTSRYSFYEDYMAIIAELIEEKSEEEKKKISS
ncbi:hypothetical protein [Anaerolentibacter hominis]|uniref:hypothetical protein n=1 Tax=Anaerolentibacter hominis TaxID=3079009 RepID=UPI0031B80FB2